MLDDFCDSQFNAYSLLKNSILKNKLSHAYLINANNYDQSFDFLMAFVKFIVCPHHYTNSFNKECGSCNLCGRLEGFNYSELKIIDTDSLVIKKEQLLELQSDFSRSSIEGNYRIYVIKDCDKMNKQAANSLLKFLEEPVSGVIAILLTNYLAKVPATVVSRCQIINLVNVIDFQKNSSLENLAFLCCNSKESISLFTENESNVEIIDTVLTFIDYFENNGLDIFIFMKDLWYNKIQKREDAVIAFLLIIQFYYDVLKSKFDIDQYFFSDKIEFVERVVNLNSLDSILHKIDVFNYGYEMIKCNLNLNLLMEDLIIRLGD